MAGRVSLGNISRWANKAYKWMGRGKYESMGKVAVEHLKLAKGIRIAAPLLTGLAFAGCDWHLQSGLEVTAILAWLTGVGAGEVGTRAVRGNVRNTQLAETVELKTAVLKDKEKTVAEKAEEIKELKNKMGKVGMRYLRMEELSKGVGATAKIILATDLKFDQLCVLKVPDLNAAIEQRVNMAEFLELFKGEAKKIKELEHPNIVKVYDVPDIDLQTYRRITKKEVDPKQFGKIEIPIIVMEYVKGLSLEQKLADLKGMGFKGFRLSSAIEKMLALVSAMQKMKENGITHRDIKLDNIMEIPGGEIKLIDFGIARDVEGGGTVLGMQAPPKGTPGYMAPEQMGLGIDYLFQTVLKQEAVIKPWSDLPGAGKSFWQLLTGDLPTNDPATILWNFLYNDRDWTTQEKVSGKREMFQRILRMPIPRIESRLEDHPDRLIKDLERVDTTGQSGEVRDYQKELIAFQQDLLAKLNEIFQRTLAINPHERYEDLEMFKEDLEMIKRYSEQYQEGLEEFLRLSDTVSEPTRIMRIDDLDKED